MGSLPLDKSRVRGSTWVDSSLASKYHFRLEVTEVAYNELIAAVYCFIGNALGDTRAQVLML